MRRTLLMIVILGIGLAVFIQNSSAQEFPKMKLRYANIVGAQIPTSKADIFVAEQLTKRTNGAVQVKIYHGGVLGSSTEMIDLIGSGAIDMGNFIASYVFSRLPMQAFFSMPLAYPDIPTVTKLTRRGWETSKKLQEDLVKNNLYPFLFRGLAIVHIISKRPIRTLDDLKGMKIRSWGAIFPKLLEKFHAVPVNLKFSDVYEGLQRGTIDAALTSYGAAFAYKNFEVAKYLCDINLGADSAYCSYINLDLYRSWPQSLKDLFNETAKEAEALSDKTLIGFDKYALAQMQKAGAKLIHFRDQAKVDAFRDYAIDLTAETISKQGDAYKEPAKEYAKWLKAQLAKIK